MITWSTLAIADTGSNTTFMNDALVKSLKLPLQPPKSNSKVQLAQVGATGDTDGRTDPLAFCTRFSSPSTVPSRRPTFAFSSMALNPGVDFLVGTDMLDQVFEGASAMELIKYGVEKAVWDDNNGVGPTLMSKFMMLLHPPASSSPAVIDLSLADANIVDHVGYNKESKFSHFVGYNQDEKLSDKIGYNLECELSDHDHENVGYNQESHLVIFCVITQLLVLMLVSVPFLMMSSLFVLSSPLLSTSRLSMISNARRSLMTQLSSVPFWRTLISRDSVHSLVLY